MRRAQKQNPAKKKEKKKHETEWKDLERKNDEGLKTIISKLDTGRQDNKEKKDTRGKRENGKL